MQRLNNDARRARVAAVDRCAERRKRAQADTREAQEALEVKMEGGRADQAGAAGLEKQVGISRSSSTRSLFASSSWLSNLGRSFFFTFKI